MALSNTSPSNTSPSEQPFVVRRGRVNSVDLFEVKENELDILEKGSPADLYLNFSIFLLSAAVTTTATLFSATFAKPVVQTVFIVVTVIGALLGIFLLVLWHKTRTSVRAVIKGIRCRIPPDAIPPAASEALAPSSAPSVAQA